MVNDMVLNERSALRLIYTIMILMLTFECTLVIYK